MDKPLGTTLISHKRLMELREAEEFLDALEQMGVADWPVYREAQELLADQAVEEEKNNNG